MNDGKKSRERGQAMVLRKGRSKATCGRWGHHNIDHGNVRVEELD
jgi:hypothetical protein